MNPSGHTRSRVARDHALITPDTHVWSPPPGWSGATAAVHISPALGARFSQSTVVLETGGRSGPPSIGVERVIHVLTGRLRLSVETQSAQVLSTGMYAYLPPDEPHEIEAAEPSRIVLFEKPYYDAEEFEPPEPLVGAADDVPAEPFMGDEDARLQVLLPTDARFDLAVNIFTYQPGATLPQVEIHVMEHGLVMLAGAGVYRLGDSWYPVETGDVIWMASYCPQWFAATGKEPARYLYYKDVNRDPLE